MTMKQQFTKLPLEKKKKTSDRQKKKAKRKTGFIPNGFKIKMKKDFYFKILKRIKKTNPKRFQNFTQSTNQIGQKKKIKINK